MQQGRVMLDDDFNDAERIRLEEERRVNIDVIGPVGSPDAGFLVSNGSITGGGCDFDILAGTLYLGGLRLWNPATTKVSLQDDWLQQAAGDRPAPVEGRIDLVYVEAWQQPVTAVEDTELFEVALGGPDSSTRLRTMWRVRLATANGSDCPDAWKSLVGTWTGAGKGTVDATGERIVDTKLQVTYEPGALGDLCTPKIAGGYLGAENQTIRVELVDATHFTWGFDNGAPIYQATIGADRKTITLLTAPHDQAHWPTAGQVVEILPWSSVLPNHEKLAQETGQLARVAGSFDPDPSKHSFVLDAINLVPVGFGDGWKTRSDAAQLGDITSWPCYVRVWDRGDDVSSDLAILFGASAVSLGSTGIKVTISGAAKNKGDHWVIAARPRTPDQVVPWNLEDGRLPHGTRRFFAPLALIRWHAGGTFDLLHDCRPFFLPLTRQRGCCTYTVGDDEHSYGQFRKIQDAVNALPEDGGKVCVLPGTYNETVYVLGKKNVTIEGCGRRSRVLPNEKFPWTIVIVRSTNVTIKDLGVETGNKFGVVIFGDTKIAVPKSLNDVAWAAGGEGSTGILLDGLVMQVGGRSAILAFGGHDLTIRDCDIEIHALEAPVTDGSDVGRWPAILSFADNVLIENNRIIAAFEGGNEKRGITYTHTALGGIQIGGGSEGVEIRRNLIQRGNGDGITLGSWAWVPKESFRANLWDSLVGTWIWQSGISIHINAEGCIEVDWDPPPPNDPNGDPMVPVSMGEVTDVLIVENQISQMGKSGVGVARFFDLSGQDELIVVRRLEIRDNRIAQCLRLPIPSVPAKLGDVVGQGAITLAEVEALLVHGNDIHDNGKQHIDPVCGVFALVTSGAVIEHNRIVDNAPHVSVRDAVRLGWRGGVVLVSALPPPTLVEISDKAVTRMNGEPSARITDNIIVVPEGRAVVVLGLGPMVIADNQLSVHGVGLADIGAVLMGGSGGLANELKAGALQGLLDILGGVAVTVIDLGMSNELFWLQLLFYTSLTHQDVTPKAGLDPRPPIAASGQIRFQGNQVGVDLLAAPNNLIFSAVNLITLDDVSCANNQIEVDRFLDRMLVTTFVVGMTARVLGNRIKESLFAQLASLLGVSIYSLGVLLNMTTGNQTSRCIVGLGLRKTLAPNQVMLELFAKDACGTTKTAAAGMQAKVMPKAEMTVIEE
jgi:hypothetical protein